MQNKPNLRKAKMNISNYIKNTYENKTLGRRGKNKPNRTQFQTQPLSNIFHKFIEDRSAALRMTIISEISLLKGFLLNYPFGI
jgi:hypothetical protein